MGATIDSETHASWAASALRAARDVALELLLVFTYGVLLVLTPIAVAVMALTRLATPRTRTRKARHSI
jgi:hypothetical protein